MLSTHTVIPNGELAVTKVDARQQSIEMKLVGFENCLDTIIEVQSAEILCYLTASASIAPS